MHQISRKAPAWRWEDAVCLADQVERCQGNFTRAFLAYQQHAARIASCCRRECWVTPKAWSEKSATRSSCASTPPNYDGLQWLYGHGSAARGMHAQKGRQVTTNVAIIDAAGGLLRQRVGAKSWCRARLMRAALPHDKPMRRTGGGYLAIPATSGRSCSRPETWRRSKGRAARAGIGQPGWALQATPSIFIGLQLGETAPTAPSAGRMVIEGSGGFTLVQAEQCPMERRSHSDALGSLGARLDALHPPFARLKRASYGRRRTATSRRVELRHRRSGLVPIVVEARRTRYPLLRIPLDGGARGAERACGGERSRVSW